MSTKYNLKPLGNYVVIKLIEEKEKKSQGGIILPDQVREKPQLAKVVAAGPGLTDMMTGKPVPMSVADGDVVLINKFACQKMELPDGSTYALIGEGDVFCVVTAEEVEA
jgi:chaperonin GroES